LKEKPIVDSFKVITPKEALSTIEKISPALKSLSFKESENPLPYSISIKLKNQSMKIKSIHFLMT